jgi:hypothetical protein
MERDERRRRETQMGEFDGETADTVSFLLDWQRLMEDLGVDTPRPSDLTQYFKARSIAATWASVNKVTGMGFPELYRSFLDRFADDVYRNQLRQRVRAQDPMYSREAYVMAKLDALDRYLVVALETPGSQLDLILDGLGADLAQLVRQCRLRGESVEMIRAQLLQFARACDGAPAPLNAQGATPGSARTSAEARPAAAPVAGPASAQTGAPGVFVVTRTHGQTVDLPVLEERGLGPFRKVCLKGDAFATLDGRLQVMRHPGIMRPACADCQGYHAFLTDNADSCKYNKVQVDEWFARLLTSAAKQRGTQAWDPKANKWRADAKWVVDDKHTWELRKN